MKESEKLAQEKIKRKLHQSKTCSWGEEAKTVIRQTQRSSLKLGKPSPKEKKKFCNNAKREESLLRRVWSILFLRLQKEHWKGNGAESTTWKRGDRRG